MKNKSKLGKLRCNDQGAFFQKSIFIERTFACEWRIIRNNEPLATFWYFKVNKLYTVDAVMQLYSDLLSPWEQPRTFNGLLFIDRNWIFRLLLSVNKKPTSRRYSARKSNFPRILSRKTDSFRNTLSAYSENKRCKFSWSAQRCGNMGKSDSELTIKIITNKVGNKNNHEIRCRLWLQF